MDREKLMMKVAEACDRYELSPDDMKVIADWMQNAIVQQALLQNVEDGHAEICGLNEAKNDVLFRITEDGRKYINQSTEKL